MRCTCYTIVHVHMLYSAGAPGARVRRQKPRPGRQSKERTPRGVRAQVQGPRPCVNFVRTRALVRSCTHALMRSCPQDAHCKVAYMCSHSRANSHRAIKRERKMSYLEACKEYPRFNALHHQTSVRVRMCMPCTLPLSMKAPEVQPRPAHRGQRRRAAHLRRKRLAQKKRCQRRLRIAMF